MPRPRNVLPTAAPVAVPVADAFDALVNNTAVAPAPSSSKKSSSPALTLPETINPALLQFVSKKAAMKNAESEMRTEEAKILEWAMPEIDRLNLNKEAPPTSWLLNGKMEGGAAISVKLVMSDKFSLSQDATVLAALKTTLSEDYASAVVEETTVSIKPEVFESPELKAEFMALIQSGDNFRKFFEVEKKSIAKKGLLDKIWKIAKTTDRLASIRSLLVPAKPALK